MSEDADRDSRSEEPTERKIADALEKGNVPFSREAVTLGSLVAILLVLKTSIGWSAAGLWETLGVLLENAGQVDLANQDAATLYLHVVAWQATRYVLPLVLLAATGGLIASLVQNVPRAAADRITPKGSRISPLSGWSRIFSTRAMGDFIKTVVKSLALFLLAALILKSVQRPLLALQSSEPTAIPGSLHSAVVTIMSAFCTLALVFAGFDIFTSRRRWRRGLMMTRQELKDEMRQSEGDPHLKARIRSIARQRSSRKMFAKIPTATMIITNPTHFAIALRYTRAEGGAPVVVAKGVDFLALRIRETAESHGIPMVENRPLAHALYEKVDIDESIPSEFYRAVAEIIHFLELRRRYPRSAEVIRH